MIDNSSRGKSVMVLDTTLRDGMQTPGIGCNLEKRVFIAKEIAGLNPDIMEVGMPANVLDYTMIPVIANAVHEVNPNVRAGVLIRGTDYDIRKCKEVFSKFEGLKYVHIFIPTSDSLLVNSVGKSKVDAIKLTREFVSKVVDMGYPMQFSPEDAAATKDRGFLFDIYGAAYDAGCRRFNVTDTTGWSPIEHFTELVRDLHSEFPDVSLSVHCHDDAGLAVANSVYGIMNGANRVEGTVLKLGERAGNADWMNVVTDLSHMYGISSRVIMGKFYPVVGRISEVLGINRFLCHPVTGRNAYRSSSGVHLKAIRKDPKSYHHLSSELVGAELEIVVGQTSSEATMKEKLKHFKVDYSNLDVFGVLAFCAENGGISDRELVKYC